MLAFGLFLILLFFISLVSHRLERTIITAPIVFTLGGMSLVWTQTVEPERIAGSHTALLLGEITLVMLLFTDAAHLKTGIGWYSRWLKTLESDAAEREEVIGGGPRDHHRNR